MAKVHIDLLTYQVATPPLIRALLPTNAHIYNNMWLSTDTWMWLDLFFHLTIVIFLPTLLIISSSFLWACMYSSVRRYRASQSHALSLQLSGVFALLLQRKTYYILFSYFALCFSSPSRPSCCGGACAASLPFFFCDNSLAFPRLLITLIAFYCMHLIWKLLLSHKSIA